MTTLYISSCTESQHRTSGWTLTACGPYSDRTWTDSSVDNLIYTMLHDISYSYEGVQRLGLLRDAIEDMIQQRTKTALKV